MKSRATTYLLIAGVAVIWAIVLWRVFARGGDAPPTPQPRSRAAAESIADTLMLDYRDPFLGTAAPKPAAAAANMVAVQQEPPAPPPVAHRLRYRGRIVREGRPYCLIEINGALHTLRKGDAADGYRLETVWQDSVGLRWKNETVVAR